MLTTDTMSRGYPALADMLAWLQERGIELVDENNSNHITEFYQMVWGILNAVDASCAIGVYLATSTTFNVRGGHYRWGADEKEYSSGEAVDPTDNDTTYIWMNDDNTIGSGIDGDDWPATEHIKLAEIDVDEDGVITALRDLRGKTFLRRIGELNGGDMQELASNMAVPFILTAQLVAGNTVQIYNAAAPFKFRITDAWSIAQSADAGTWKLTDGANNITNAVAVTAADKTVNRAGTIDDAYYEIAADGSLSVVGDGSLADVRVQIACVRVP